MNLFVVEAPNKCAKLKKILGNDFTVVASVGHILEIPHRGMNIDFDNDFTPKYVLMDGKNELVSKIKRLADDADKIYLATDPDREGEAIAYHVYSQLTSKQKKKCVRSVYREITKKSVLEAVKNPREIDMNVVDAQKARQVLDRVIGYKISPLLWHSVAPKTSAGRVQSVALKIVCEREKEINDFKPTDFWYIDADLDSKDGKFTARMVTADKDNRELDQEKAKKDKKALDKATYKLAKAERKQKKQSPYPPFDTASLQTACSSVFKWPSKKTTSVAQKLYENGSVTYIRTDSFNIAKEAMKEVRELIKAKAGQDYIPSKPRYYAQKKSSSSQEAHECIRPTDCTDKGDHLTGDEKKMYRLIRDRFIACQMADAVFDTVSYDVEASSGHTLTASGQTMRFDGWTKMYRYYKAKQNSLPNLKKNESLPLIKVKMSKHSTKAPPRYNEGSLIKLMKKEGVGRPSTYSSIMDSIQKRGYVKAQKKGSLEATDLGMKAYEYLQEYFKDFIMDIGFTANLEQDLDVIEEGDKTFLDVVSKTYNVLNDQIEKISGHKVSDQTCLKCGDGTIVERRGKFGLFYACDQYPKCKCVYDLQEDGSFTIKKKGGKPKGKQPKVTDVECPECKENGREGYMVQRKSDYGIFFGCQNYPKCKCICVKDDDGKISRKK